MATGSGAQVARDGHGMPTPPVPGDSDQISSERVEGGRGAVAGVSPAASRKASDDEGSRLAEAARKGDRRALDRLVEKHITSLICLFRYLRAPESMVEDLVQETLLKVILHLDQYQPGRSFSAWLMGVGRNLYYDTCRKRQREQRHLKLDPGTPVANVAETAIARHQLDQAMASLSDEARLMLEMRLFLGLSFTEMAGLLDATENALRVRFHRALQHLRQIESQGDGYGA